MVDTTDVTVNRQTFKGIDIVAGTVTADTPQKITQTWNSGGVSFGAREVDVTDSASAASSLLDRLRVGGVDKYGVRKDGVVVLSAGLKFPATQNPSSDVNTLDDYEEGTFTPTFSAATPPTGVTYSNQTGDYVKVGRLVLCRAYVILTSKGSGGSGQASIGSLPFAAGGSNVSIVPVRFANITTHTNMIGLSSTTSLLLQSFAGVSVDWSSHVADNSSFIVCGAYYA